MIKKICFLENSKKQYDGSHRCNPILRGAELAIINYSEELAKKGYEVFVLNNCLKACEINKVKYFNINNKNNKFECDVAIANADANLFSNVKSRKNFLLSHSIQNFGKFLKKNQLFSFLKYKPKVLCFSRYHLNNRSFLTSFYGKKLIIPSIDNDFFDTPLEKNEINENAIFYSRGDRNSNLVLQIWKNLYSKIPRSQKLFVTSDVDINYEDMKKFNIQKKEFMNKHDLINFLKKFRLLIIPGHKGEVFCNVAEEAKALGVPIVTLGLGALNERVIDNYNGFSCNNISDFEDKILNLLQNDSLYLKFKNNLIKDRGLHKWKDSIESLILLF